MIFHSELPHLSVDLISPRILKKNPKLSQCFSSVPKHHPAASQENKSWTGEIFSKEGKCVRRMIEAILRIVCDLFAFFLEEWRSGLAAEFTCAGVCPGMRGRFLLPSLISFRDTLVSV